MDRIRIDRIRIDRLRIDRLRIYHLRIYHIVMACLMSAVCAGAGAETIYKCIQGGKVSYTATPCDQGSVTAIDIAPTPPADPEVAARLARQRAMLDGFIRARSAAEERDYRAQLRAERAHFVHRQRCEKMDIARRKAGQEAESAMGNRKYKLRDKAYRLRQEYTATCPG